MGTKRVEVLKGLDMGIVRGEMLAVLGASGVGKTTLLHLLGALERPDEGAVVFDGVDLSTLNEGELARLRNRKMGFVFQFHHLLREFSALENVMMPALVGGFTRRKARETAEKVLIEVGLKDRLDHRPGELSGGEQQRVAVARALLMNPLVILADEPTGNLDEVTGEQVHHLLREINRKHGMTFAIVTHNVSFARSLDRQVELHGGVIREFKPKEGETD